ncbi:ribonuclease H1-like isoform X1 [Aphis craccivora]|uniref:ribonuclease H n=1 Tax=Aphis craccivora TaxID=307492 RepID=A0A6G0YJJ1_APHCR|nr:ribonuclease H1-like isoform X1 [Aphis craccivora]
MYFNYNRRGEVVVYVDGACRNNGTRWARAGAGVWFKNNHELNLSSKVPGIPTNNNAEIFAAVLAIKILLKNNEYRAEIITDSKFLYNCMTRDIFKWKNNGWMTNKGSIVANKYMLQKLDNHQNVMQEVTFTHIRGHSNNFGNQQADMLARNAVYP